MQTNIQKHKQANSPAPARPV